LIKRAKSNIVQVMTRFFVHRSGRELIWTAVSNNRITGCVAIVEYSDKEAQLRWFLVHPDLRRRGIGKTLIQEAMTFSKENGYSSVFLWTSDVLLDAANLYRSFGFTMNETKTRMHRGRHLLEQRYDLNLVTK
jgi:N-acetylglutamate synthase-like GNAT family acetyltransferase